MLALVILFALAVVDRLTKISALANPRQVISILWRIFWYSPFVNTAGPLSLPMSPALTLVLALVVSGVAAVMAFKSQTTMSRLAFGLIAIGVLSNAYDRFEYGYVVDVFRVVGGLSFNVSDIFIVVGIALILPGLVLF